MRREIGSGIRGRLLACLVMLLALDASQAQQPAQTQDEAGVERQMRAALAELDPAKPLTTLEAWDGFVDGLTRASWGVHELKSETETSPISFAITSVALWEKYVLPEEVTRRLQELRARAGTASDAHDEAALQKALAEAAPLFAQQKFRVMILGLYGFQLTTLGVHWEALKPWYERASPDERTLVDRDMQAAGDEIVAQAEQTLQSADTTLARAMLYSKSRHPARDKLNERRIALVKAQSALPNPIPIEARTNQATCPPPPQSMSQRESPALDGSQFPSSEEFYPPAAKMADMQGAPVVRVSVSETGCVVRAEIAQTSGSAELDAGALNLAMAGRYLPGSKDGKPVSGSMVFRVKFELL